MKRDSTEHNPRLDDEMKKELRSLTGGAPVESRKEEWHEQEGAGDDEREPSARTAPAPALGPDEVSGRQELSRHLRSAAFPADRDALLADAEQNQAPPAVLSALRALPAGQTFATVYEVWQALGGEVEHVAGRPDHLDGTDGG